MTVHFSGQLDDFSKMYKLLISSKVIHKSNQNLGSSIAFKGAWVTCTCACCDFGRALQIVFATFCYQRPAL